MADLLWLIPTFPFVGSMLIWFLGKPLLKSQSHWPCILGAIGACVVSFMVFFAVRAQPVGYQSFTAYYTWMQAGNFDVSFSLRADALTAIMLVTVTFVGSLITIYSAGYMHGDPGYPRYFAAVSLFISAMTILVLGNNFIMLYAGWEGVGLCSYLLVGFWFAKPSAAAAARKAFLVTRLGDFGFALGILLIWAFLGTVDYTNAEGTGVFDRVHEFHGHEGLLLAACLLLFCGAIGKSAQFPLHVWLPDAMEGPSPVSALIHAATMVTAGVYMVARCMPLFREVPVALAVVAGIGAISAFIAALAALTQTDLKRVLAYSTISQLGYMFLALGCAVNEELVPIAVVAGIFHLFTHAFFKALLFLSAGSVMHAMNNIIDMRRFSGLRKLMPLTHIGFLCGALALSGFPLASGFWSKDEILGVAFEASHESPILGKYYMICFLLGLVTAGLTAFYTFRAYFLTFWGPEKIPHEAGHHAHENPYVMTIPLLILGAFALFAGLVFGPTGLFADMVTRTPGLGTIESHGLDIILMLGGTVFVLAGIGTAYWFYVARPGTADELASASPGLYELSLNKFYIDEIYDWAIVKAMTGWAVFCRIFDLHVLDGLIDLIAFIPRWLGAVFFRPIQNGLVQFYALAMVLGVTVFLVALVRALTG
ncbi:MAG: NADH-quinone oxidoreductase subunit L [Gemmataceae bacterium]